MLEQVGLADAARKRAGGYSMGMRQRLGLAAAMLGDPQVLILDEPANGLDPEGIRWLRGFLRHVSSQGKTVLVSSHMLQEVEQTVDDIVIIAHGRLVEHGAMSDLHGTGSSLVRTTDVEALLAALRPVDVAGSLQPDGSLLASSTDLQLIGDIALGAGLPIHELRLVATDLESLFFSLTEGHELGDGAEAAPAPADGTEL
jgi:ABC-2 type transport system ATP-binding protein